jgi:hypothetical protein
MDIPPRVAGRVRGVVCDLHEHHLTGCKSLERAQDSLGLQNGQHRSTKYEVGGSTEGVADRGEEARGSVRKCQPEHAVEEFKCAQVMLGGW